MIGEMDLWNGLTGDEGLKGENSLFTVLEGLDRTIVRIMSTCASNCEHTANSNNHMPNLRACSSSRPGRNLCSSATLTPESHESIIFLVLANPVIRCEAVARLPRSPRQYNSP